MLALSEMKACPYTYDQPNVPWDAAEEALWVNVDTFTLVSPGPLGDGVWGPVHGFPVGEGGEGGGFNATVPGPPNGYRFNPKAKTVFGAPWFDGWLGYYNESTMCKFDYAAAHDDGMYNASKTQAPHWQERGSPDMTAEWASKGLDEDSLAGLWSGLDHFPTRWRDQEPPSSKEGVYADGTLVCERGLQCEDEKGEAWDKRKHMLTPDAPDALQYGSMNLTLTCDFSALGDEHARFEPTRNFSSFAVGDAFTNGDFEYAEHAITVPLFLTESSVALSHEDVHVETSNNYTVTVDEITVEDLLASDGSTVGLKVTVNPQRFAIGSTTLAIINKSDGARLIDFTVNFQKMPWCPFTVSFMGMAVVPMAYTSTIISISVIFQALFFVSFSGLGDFGSYRKMILLQVSARPNLHPPQPTFLHL
jgi:hypothetical protein